MVRHTLIPHPIPLEKNRGIQYRYSIPLCFFPVLNTGIEYRSVFFPVVNTGIEYRSDFSRYLRYSIPVSVPGIYITVRGKCDSFSYKIASSDFFSLLFHYFIKPFVFISDCELKYSHAIIAIFLIIL